MATTNTNSNNLIIKVALEPGTKITLEHNGAPLTAAQLDGKSLAVTKSGDSLMVHKPSWSTSSSPKTSP